MNLYLWQHIESYDSNIMFTDQVDPNMSTFSMSALIWVNHKVISQFSQPIFNEFYIQTANATIQYFDCVLNKIV